MPIKRITPTTDEQETEPSLDVFQVQEAIEVYDGRLALAVDHLLNHIKALVSVSYIPDSKDLQQALKRHPLLRRMQREQALQGGVVNGRTPDRVLLLECQRLLDAVVEIAHLTAWPETASQAQSELASLQRDVPFLDYRYDNDPYPSDSDHEEQ